MPAKFRIPETRPHGLARQRLYDRLTEGTRRPLTLVSAPAGAGKTVLVSQWVAAGLSPGRVIWISLDEEDTRPGVFWAHVLQGLRRGGVDVAASPPLRTTRVTVSFLVLLAAAVSQQRELTVLVLDNVEVLAETPILNALNFLLRHSAPQLRLVLLSRMDPALPLYRFRLEGGLTEVRLPDLSFTVPEAEGLLALHGVHLPEPLVEALVERTKGWAAGLRLAAMSMQRTTSQDAERVVRGFTGNREDLAEYFLAEVLDAQPPPIRDFLLRTSVAEELSPGLCDRLSGRTDSARILAAQSHANTFVEPSDVPGRYRYHPLFRDLLLAQLQYEIPGGAAPLHRRAARWLAEEGQFLPALRHAVAIRDWAGGAGFLVNGLALGRLLIGPDSGAMVQVLSGMPEETSGTAAALVLAVLALAGGDLEACERQLRRVREGMAGMPGGPAAVQVGVQLLEAVAAGTRGSVADTLAATDRLRRTLDAAEDSGRAVPPDLPALLALVRARAHLWAGDFDAAEEALVPAIEEVDRSGCETVRLCLVGYLAFANALWGRSRRAARLGHEAVTGSERIGLVVTRHVPVATVALAWTYLDEYDVAQARQEIRAVTAGTVRDPLVRAAVGLIRVRLLRGRGEYAAAVDAIGQLRAGVRPVPVWFDRMLDITRASIPLAGPAPANGATPPNGPPLSNGAMPPSGLRLDGSGPPRMDDPVLDDLVAAIAKEENVPLEVRVVGQLLVSRKELESGHEAVARAALEKALRLAKAENLRRPIIEAPARVRGLLRGSPDLAERHLWLGPALVSVPRRRIPGTGAAPAVIDPLTYKEQEVLDNLAQLLSTDEIARKMFVSVNTVKTHVRKILRKLAVSRRNDAIRRARELGLLRSEPP